MDNGVTGRIPRPTGVTGCGVEDCVKILDPIVQRWCDTKGLPIEMFLDFQLIGSAYFFYLKILPRVFYYV